MFLQGATCTTDITEPRLDPSFAYSTASSTKSCHDMVNGVSDFILLSHRFPHDQWEKALEYYSNYGKANE